MNKLIIAITLNTILFVASVANLITTETQVVSTVTLIIMYYCGRFIED